MDERVEGLGIYSPLLPEEKALTLLEQLTQKARAAEPQSVAGIKEAEEERGFDVVPPPDGLDFAALATLFHEDPTHHACCVLKARAVAAGGYRVVHRDGRPAEPPADLLDYLNGVFPDGLDAFLYPLALDFEVLGNAYIEVCRKFDGRFRNNLGLIASLHHVPGFTVRILVPGHRTGCAYVQRYQGHQTFFRAFETPEPTSLERQPVVNELIHVKNHSPTSYFYGIPDIVAALRAMLGWRLGMEYLNDLLEKKGMPHYMLLLNGGKNFFTEEDQQTLNQYINQLLSVGSGRILAVATPQGVEGELEQLNLNVPADDLLRFVEECRDQVIRVHGVPPRLLAILESGRLGGTAEGQTQIEQFKTFVIRPRQRMWENILTRALLWPRPKWREWRIRLGEFDFEDVVRSMQANTGYLRTGVLTVNEVRAELGKPPVEGGDVPVYLFGGEPVPVAMLSSGSIEEKQGSRIQSVLCSKDRFRTLSEAKRWCRENGFKTNDVDETENYYRFRQFPPEKCRENTFRTIELTDGVKAIICIPVKQKVGEGDPTGEGTVQCC